MRAGIIIENGYGHTFKDTEVSGPMEVGVEMINSQEIKFLGRTDINVGGPDCAPLQVKTGRNQPCPCGSGKKFKHCHRN